MHKMETRDKTRVKNMEAQYGKVKDYVNLYKWLREARETVRV